MREMFEELRREGSDAIHRWCKEGQQEDVQLDFKLMPGRQNGELDKEGSRVLAKALSAFANSAGGLLVFGVDARKNADDVDAAVWPPQPIHQIDRFSYQVRAEVGKLLMPRYEGIEIEQIDEKSAPGKGYLAIWVERSERRPHRSEAKGDKQYYKRAGDNSFPMEHYDIEDAFKRNTVATLALQRSEIVRHPSRETESEVVVFRFILKNVGSVSARAPYVLISKCEGAVPQTITRYFTQKVERGVWLEIARLEAGVLFAGDVAMMIHPELEVPAFDLKFSARKIESGEWRIISGSSEIPTLSIEFGFGSENGRMVRGKMEWTEGDLARLLGAAPS